MTYILVRPDIDDLASAFGLVRPDMDELTSLFDCLDSCLYTTIEGNGKLFCFKTTTTSELPECINGK